MYTSNNFEENSDTLSSTLFKGGYNKQLDKQHNYSYTSNNNDLLLTSEISSDNNNQMENYIFNNKHLGGGNNTDTSIKDLELHLKYSETSEYSINNLYNNNMFIGGNPTSAQSCKQKKSLNNVVMTKHGGQFNNTTNQEYSETSSYAESLLNKNSYNSKYNINNLSETSISENTSQIFIKNNNSQQGGSTKKKYDSSITSSYNNLNTNMTFSSTSNNSVLEKTGNTKQMTGGTVNGNYSETSLMSNINLNVTYSETSSNNNLHSSSKYLHKAGADYKINNTDNSAVEQTQSDASHGNIENLIKLLHSDSEQSYNYNNINLNEMQKYVMKMIHNGFDVKINNIPAQHFFTNYKTNDINSKYHSEVNDSDTEHLIQQLENILQTDNTLEGGAKHDTKKRTINPGFAAFQDLKKYISNELNIVKQPIIATKITTAVKNEVLEKYPNLTKDKIMEESKKYFIKHKDHFNKMYNDMVKK